MNKEVLNKAKVLEEQIGNYELISFIMSYPYKSFNLFRRKPRIQAASYNTGTNVTITDPELTKLISEYCDQKVKDLKQELEAL